MSTSTGTGDAALLSSSRVMAVGTVLSRVTGLIRTIVLAAALGLDRVVPEAYNAANTAPNAVYDLLLGGVLTSVLVPLLVRAARDDEERGALFARQLLSSVVLLLGAATLVVVVFAPQLMSLYVTGNPAELQLATEFARFFLPQIFFYGVGATIGAILNTRGSFAAPMWTPILNNLVVIATLIAFIATSAGQPKALTSSQVLLLGLGTTAGIVLQTIALVPALRAVGFRLRLTTNIRGAGLGRAAARLGGWTLVYVGANQIAFLIVVRLATGAKGLTTYLYAFLLFSLPHAVVAVSVISALLPGMSRDAADGRLGDVARSLARGTRLSSVILVPAAALLIALHAPIADLLFSYRHTSPAGTAAIGTALAFFAIGLVPFSAFQLQLRAFYSLADARTPALINLVASAVNVAADLVLYYALPVSQRINGLAAGYALSYAVAWVVTTRVLRARLGPLGTATIVRTLVRLGIAAGLGATAAWGVAVASQNVLGRGLAGSLTAVVVGAAVAGAIVVLTARRMRVTEMDQLVNVVRRRAV